jgi:phospholipid/cholesterol/gamma-HCH transport system substrate-binding protein
MPASRQQTEIHVGIFVLLGAVLIGGLLFQFGDFPSFEKEGYPVHVELRDATGIREGSPVRLGGVQIGVVGTEPELGKDFTTLSLELRILPDRKIPRGSEVRIGTSGLMGDSFVRIIPPAEPAASFLEEGDRIEASGPRSMDDLATGAVETLEEAGVVLKEVGDSVKRLNEVFERFDKGVLNEDNIEHLNVMMKTLRESSERIDVASKRIDPLLAETEGAARDVSKAAGTANEAFGEVSEGMTDFAESLETIDPVIGEFDTTLDELRSTLQSVNGLMNRIENGSGLASALLNDAELRRDLSGFLDKLDRNGILFYPKEDRAFRNSERSQAPPAASSRPAPSRKESKPPERKGLFPWLKKKQ